MRRNRRAEAGRHVVAAGEALSIWLGLVWMATATLPARAAEDGPSAPASLPGVGQDPLHEVGTARPAHLEGFNFRAWEEIPIQEGGLEKSFATFAREFMRENVGKAGYGGRSAVENVLSMAFEPEAWLHEPFLKVRQPDLVRLFNHKHPRVSPMELEGARPRWEPLVYPYLDEQGHLLRQSIKAEGGPQPKANPAFRADAQRELSKLFHKIDFIFGNPEAGLPTLVDRLRIVPAVDFRGEKTQWRTVEELRVGTREKSEAEAAVIGAYLSAHAAYLRRDAAGFNQASGELTGALEALDVPLFKPRWKFRLDRWDSTIGPFRVAGWIYLAATILFVASYLAGRRVWATAAHATLALGASVNVLALVIRGVLAGRTPVSNLFESGVFIVGVMATASLILSLYYRTYLVGLGGAALGAFSMGIANSIPLHYGVKIMPLVDALQSYWLHLHVTSMLTSYAFFAIASFVAAAYVGRYLMLRARPAFDPTSDPTLLYLDSLNFRIITIGMPILTGGVILGAVWAAEAWGRPWAFDPKETAAAITWMIYALYLHARLFLGWRGLRGVTLSLLGFGAVIFTYLGVSFFLPGLHSYVSEEGVSFTEFLRKLIPGG